MSGPHVAPPQLPGFEYVELLGGGGFSDVFKYEQLGLGRLVAVKVLLTDIDADVHASFAAEASVMAQLSNHPSIVSIYQAAITPDGRPYLVMEFCPPPHLLVRLRKRPLSVAKALDVVVQLCGAVETAHRLGILHRDIKPANILFTEFGRAALTDFGISVNTSSAGAGQGIGVSVPWAPPEQLTAGAPMGASSDVYSLAATLWAALVGHSPFYAPGGANDSVSLGARVKGMPVPPTGRRDVPESLERALRTAMAKSPHERFDTALSFARALQGIQAELHQPVTTVDVLDEHVADVVAEEGVGGTRVSGFVSIDPDVPSTSPSGSTSPTVHPGWGAPPVGQSPRGDDATRLRARSAGGRSSAAPGAGSHRAPLVVAGLLVVLAVVAGAIWLGTRAPGGTEQEEAPVTKPEAVDPIGPAGPLTPTSVSVSVRGPDQLRVAWKNPDPQPGDTYSLHLQADPSALSLDPAHAIETDRTTLVVRSGGERCVTVRTVRGSHVSEPVLKCDLG
ncbi:serine/threonine protein kinase [Nocardioides sp. JQ2195]|uniref:serine/threonine-protein kinase n=1 Tax=Nocardioides sp. JQ2195 TaxID=2592334 RepID=UPI00143EAA9C|nr:serine/threonine-protein kinase [Nocardioides sp. JQ2195]QIX25408.1 serine/threonine protein kinase [Nocardioides sp. JQ2195]